ncbi:hypothetical protein Ddye_022592 [Dipteronia dyeriana]|uniref:Reverse transcriptase domain-containing protein n=1 Tax=Dipteronia dyeriana TaxID=168575 RepID=A0AAD9WRC2_9ROSI|nr:hypothetical protein Ddye_022592 [Dipteronia dyeriana]
MNVIGEIELQGVKVSDSEVLRSGIQGVDSAFVEEDFKLDKVLIALANYDGNKAPGPNELNLNFIESHWGNIQEDFVNFVTEFHKNGSVVKDLNRTFISLIPKVNNVESMKNFRPISFVNSMYKILAKVLANRLRKVLSLVIGESQMTFVKNRQIIDSSVIADEIIHKWKKESEGGLVVKLDFEKAYDSVDHRYLDSMMEGMGFGVRWRGWMKDYISTPMISVLVNGSPTSQFGIETGLRHGDPLS